ncbi:MAG: VTT domain-containing protein [Bryobacteraceae bacterium]|jgi:membrane protein DedA with SNARE-associated domain/rhodanese-related sulfurtransferase
MQYFVRLLLHYGYAVLFLAVLGQQCGIPIPADPFMVGMGSLAGDGHFFLGTAIAIAWTAAMAGDLLWFRIGQVWGSRALGLLCRISIEPDSCVARTHSRFARSGPRSLLISKFVPGLSAVATPVAGMIRMPLGQFLMWDGLGALAWVSLYLTLGFIFRRRLEELAQYFEGASRSFAVLVVGAIALYIGIKVYRRRRFLRNVAAATVQPHEVRDQIARGRELFIVDLRSAFEIEGEPVSLPGAVMRPPDELIPRHAELPVDRDIILYCSCPNDGASGKATLELRKLGYRNAKTLSGGLPAWLKLGFPTEAVS